MAEVFKIAFTAVFPLLALMTVGYICRKLKFITQDMISATNKVIFYVFLPTLIFYNLYENSFLEYIDIKLMIFIPVSVIVVVVISYYIVPKIVKEKDQQPVIVQAIVRGNLIYIGMPVMEAVAGKNHLGLMTLAITITIIIYNVSSVIIFETLRKGKVNYRSMLRGILANPLIHGAVVGMLFMSLRIPVPNMVMSVIKSMSQVATPLALVLLGAGFSFAATEKYKKQIFSTCFVRLVLVPAIMVPLAILLGFNNYEVIVVFSAMCAPTAVATYTVSQQMGGNASLAGQIVAYGSVLSMFTTFVWIIVLHDYIPLL